MRHPDKVVRTKEDGGSGLTGTALLERARQRILDCNGGRPPKLLDPFAGGGAIPLEGLRLGCAVEASDLNPVAVLILKGTVEYPQRYGQPDSRPVPDYILRAAGNGSQSSFADGDLAEAYRRNPLATDVRYWGNWILERAREELAEFYPPDPDGSVPVAYLWSRTVPCLNCGIEMPLIRQFWLARKVNKKVALQPVIDRESNSLDFRVVEGLDVTGNPSEATTSGGDTRCLLCRQVMKGPQIRQAGVQGKLSATLTAAVLTSTRGKTYRSDNPVDWKAYQAAAERLRTLQIEDRDDMPLVPDEPIDRKTLGLRVDGFGFDQWSMLFNARQLLALTTFARLVGGAYAEMLKKGLSTEYASAVTTYLGLMVDRLANQQSTLSRWHPQNEQHLGLFASQTLSMVWDYPEAIPIGDGGGSWASLLSGQLQALNAAVVSENRPAVRQTDAAQSRSIAQAIVTDPPYYNAIDYAGLSDFFFVWLKRSVGFLHSELLAMPLTPKKQQAIMASEKKKDPIERQRYVDMMRQAFLAMAQSLKTGGTTGLVFAHTDPDAWATLIEGLLNAGLVPDASWPIDTEMQGKVTSLGQARLSTSVWMACRKREGEARDAFLSDVMEEMRPVVRERLLYFWSKGIRGADFFISAIGPALSVFGRHARVLRPDGSEVSVRDFLDIVRRESTAVALEQGAARRGPRRGRRGNSTVRDVGVELLAGAAGRGRGHRPVPGHRRELRGGHPRPLDCIRGAGEEQEGRQAPYHTRACYGRRGPGQRIVRPTYSPRRPTPARRVAVEPEPDRQAGPCTAARWARPSGRRCGRSARRSPSASPTATRTAASSSACWAAASMAAPPPNRLATQPAMLPGFEAVDG